MNEETRSDEQQPEDKPGLGVVTWDDLHHAFLFLNSAPLGENSAQLCLATGKIRMHSDWIDIWDEDGEGETAQAEEGEAFLALPHKTELGLGRDLVLWFVEEMMPDRYEDVERFFQKRGAYAKFKALLAEEGLLQAWYDVENQAEEQALRNWCAENGVVIRED